MHAATAKKINFPNYFALTSGNHRRSRRLQYFSQFAIGHTHCALHSIRFNIVRCVGHGHATYTTLLTDSSAPLLILSQTDPILRM